MLQSTLLHPEILRICARGGHHSKILIADGNYPAYTKRGPLSELVCLQLCPGVPTVSQVLKSLLTALPIDEIQTMGIPEDDPYAYEGDPIVWGEYREIIKKSGSELDLVPILKWDFYQAVESPDHILTIQTADQRTWANVLLTIGCRVDF
ncbi:RbsD or FucU transport [Planctomycetales bacterium 10988]|nr:RbsD or FucU transport [Planctomycetales bacterium 10988]